MMKKYVKNYFLYDKFNQNELLLLFFHEKGGKMELVKIEILVRNPVTGKIQYDYIYGIGKKLNPINFPKKIEYEFYEKYIRDEYIYENDLITQVKVTGDQEGIAKVAYYSNKKINCIGYTYDPRECYRNFAID